MKSFALLLAGLLLTGCETAPAGPPRVGSPAPEYAAVALHDGTPTSLQALRGTPVLLNVWATWCHPCREEMPDLERLHRQYPGLRVVGVSIDERGQEDAIRAFLRDFGVTYEIWLDPDDRVTSTFALMGVPGTFLIGRDGTLLWSRVGPLTSTDPALQRALHASLAAS